MKNSAKYLLIALCLVSGSAFAATGNFNNSGGPATLAMVITYQECEGLPVTCSASDKKIVKNIAANASTSVSFDGTKSIVVLEAKTIGGLYESTYTGTGIQCQITPHVNNALNFSTVDVAGSKVGKISCSQSSEL